jgi:alpha-1,2-mannosyltransferase
MPVSSGRPVPGDLIRRISRPGSSLLAGGRRVGGRLVVGGALAGALAVALYLLSMSAQPGHMTLSWYDLRIYWDGALVARHSPGALYTWQLSPQVRFTYTPFAAWLFGLMTLMPWAVAKWLMTGASIAALVLAVSMTFRQLGWQGRRLLGGVLISCAVAFWLEPVQRALHLGQIELILMALIVWDLGQPSRRRWSGVGIGLAAGIKLVPLIFIPYLLLTRRFRQAGVAVAVLAGTVGAGFIALPSASRQWWLTGYFMDAGRTGGVASLANQSLRGLLTRLAGSVPAAAPESLGIAIGVGLAGLLGAALFHQSGKPVHGWALCALTGLLVSPISWDHHWVWMVPILVLLADNAVRATRARRWALWIATFALLAVYCDWPWTLQGVLAPRGVLPLVYGPGGHSYGELYHWHGTEVLFGNAYILGGLVLFGAMVTVAVLGRRSRGLPRPGRWQEGPFPPPSRTATDPELVRG